MRRATSRAPTGPRPGRYPPNSDERPSAKPGEASAEKRAESEFDDERSQSRNPNLAAKRALRKAPYGLHRCAATVISRAPCALRLLAAVTCAICEIIQGRQSRDLPRVRRQLRRLSASRALPALTPLNLQCPGQTCNPRCASLQLITFQHASPRLHLTGAPRAEPSQSSPILPRRRGPGRPSGQGVRRARASAPDEESSHGKIQGQCP